MQIWTLKDNGKNPGFTLFDFADRLRYFGWQVPACTLPKNAGVVIQRVVARHGVSLELAASLVDDIRGAVAHLRRHPKPSLTPQEASGFHH